MIQGDFLSSEVMTTNNGFHQKFESFAKLAKLRQIYKTPKAEINHVPKGACESHDV